MGLIRFILALSVVVGHFPGTLFGVTLIFPKVAVILFFIISGFYMSLIINEKYYGYNYWRSRFLINRFLRLWPPYILALVVTALYFIITDKQNIITSDMGLNLPSRLLYIFLNISIIGQDIAVPIFRESFHIQNIHFLHPAWSIASELNFYILAAYILSPGIKRRWTVVLLVGSLMLHIYLFFNTPYFLRDLPATHDDPSRYRFFPSLVLYFLLGNFSYMIYRKAKLYSYAKVVGWILLSSIMCLLLFLTYKYKSPTVNYKDLDSWNYWIFYLTLTLTMPFIFLATKNVSMDNFLGKLSYHIYLIHVVVLYVVSDLMKDELFRAKYCIFFSIIVTILLSFFMFMFVERPIERVRKMVFPYRKISIAAGKL